MIKKNPVDFHINTYKINESLGYSPIVQFVRNWLRTEILDFPIPKHFPLWKFSEQTDQLHSSACLFKNSQTQTPNYE